jgi:hypothetical protein
MKKILKKTLGVVFIILGFLALITPFSPGSWLILVGLEILGFRLLLERKLSSVLNEKQRKKLADLSQKTRQFFRFGSSIFSPGQRPGYPRREAGANKDSKRNSD